MSGPRTCGGSYSGQGDGQLPGSGGQPGDRQGGQTSADGRGTGTGSRSNRSRRGSSRATTAMAGSDGPRHSDTIDSIDPSGREKTVNFANCVSPPSPHDPGTNFAVSLVQNFESLQILNLNFTVKYL